MKRAWLLGLLLAVGPAAAAGADVPAACHNSFDPQCGPFLWTPDPAPNDHGTATISVAPEAPKPGETVTFTVTIDDPDSGSAARAEPVRTRYGDEHEAPSDIHCDPAWTFGFGPWDTPAEAPFHEVITIHHAYAAAGDYPAVFAFDLCGAGPYREYFEVHATVKVRNLPLGLMVCHELVRTVTHADCY